MSCMRIGFISITRKKFFAGRITATTSPGVEVSSLLILKAQLNKLHDLTEAHTKC